MGEQGDEDEVGIDPGIDFPETLGMAASPEELAQGCSLPLSLQAAGDDKVVCLLECVAEPDQRLRHLMVLLMQERQRRSDCRDAVREVDALPFVLPCRPRHMPDLGDDPSCRVNELRNRGCTLRKLHEHSVISNQQGEEVEVCNYV